ncbi:ribonuclease D [Proteus mirabilis]|uniref:ribonuclease D n=1 Tax=Proteus mirabilis TaxID=584 RepID=UPI0021BB4FB1|nr:ribonuclease D [Proteus mirabilis]MCT8223094.1 ribonuclease D [Proteus mirabilis]MDF7222359.1 ribonuclease D [Proteus mirabilis]MDF7261152.1 ribonuclease D [Proteus mirabilis]MDF7308911.1 ribonuclease D [Proteus mirabilis]MDF7362627.1 ribonuclease D [Proteus mirabilis]
MNYQFITTNTALEDVCKAASEVSQIALDTEFVRIRTYYPHLGLIQMYDGKQISLIDPLTITEWTPFVELLTNPTVLKYLHAGSEDLEVFSHQFGCVPTPMIDTQVVAAFLGYPISCGFATLVEKYEHIAIDKSESRTDWLARPLTEKQCQYASGDVFYLLPLAKKLIAQAQEAGYMDAIVDECEMIAERRQETVSPELAYRDIGNAWQLRGQQLACLKMLAEWRLNQARARDMALNFVVREEHLWSVARYLPTSLAELDALSLSGQEIRCHGRRLLDFVAKAKQIKDEACPEPIGNLIEQPNYKKAFKAIKTVIQEVSEGQRYNPELLASRRQINQLLNIHWKIKTGEPELLSRWRKALLAEKITAILAQYP